MQGKYLRNAGVQALSYGETGSPIAGGESTAELQRELKASSFEHTEAGLVSLQVLPAEEMCAPNHSCNMACMHECCDCVHWVFDWVNGTRDTRMRQKTPI